MKIRRLAALVLGTALLVLPGATAGALGAFAAASSATITVTANADEVAADGNCTLREAVAAANSDTAVDACAAGSGADTIVIPAGTYVLTGGQLTITADLAVRGAGPRATVIDAAGASRVLRTSASSVEIFGVTVANGRVAFPDDHGGGISSNGTLTLRNVTVSGNTATGGGGIESQFGTLTLENTTVSGNTALGGGGISVLGGTVYVRNSTLSGNSAVDGGAVVTDFGGTLVIVNSTVSGNASGNGAIRNYVGTTVSISSSTVTRDAGRGVVGVAITLRNTIVANNGAGDCQGAVSAGHNVDSDNSCGLTAPGDRPAVDPMLGPLADNGGATETHALNDGSPAIDAGGADCPPPATDQRGTFRPQGDRCDIGAFEFQGADVVTNTSDGGPGSLRAAIEFANGNSGPDTISFAIPSTDPGCDGGVCTIRPVTQLPPIGDGGMTIDAGTQTTFSDDANPAGPEIEIDGGGAVRGFQVSGGAELALHGVAVADGFAVDSAGGFWGGGIRNDGGTVTVTSSTFVANRASQGGAIFNDGGAVVVTDSTFSGNRSTGGGGGAIFNASGTLTVTGSTFSQNSAAADAGGIYNNSGALTVTNSTFSENSAPFLGGGILNTGSTATLTVTNSTLSRNSSGTGGGGGGIANNGGGTIVLRNTVVAHSPSGGNCRGPISDGGGNLEYPGSACPGSDADPLLDPAGLQDNGGPTETIALTSGSPAVDVAVAASCPPTDQRGVARPQGAGCDSGAYERDVAAVPPPAPTVVLNTNDSGPGSLRAALEFANSNPGPDAISFAIPTSDPGFNGQWFTIRPQSSLPPLSDDETTIDGSTQTALGDTNATGPEIEINGALTPSGTAGFAIPSTDSRIDSLAVSGFPESGIFISGDRNVVSRSYIGADAAGSIAGNKSGITIARFALSNFLGNTGRENRIIGNLITGNTNTGVSILGADENVVQGNRIERNTFGGCCSGLSIGGGFDLASDNLIGGAAPGEGNVVSGNNQAGIELHNSGPPSFTIQSSGTTIQGNLIGTDTSGSTAFGNGFAGIAVEGGPNTLIGGSESGARNVISGNGGAGIVSGADTVVEGNYIGTTAAGTTALPNGHDGVIGGGVIDRNVISGNSRNGVFFVPGASGVVARGNLIGTNAAGTAALGNGERGIRVSAADAVIGGAAAGEGNVISGNAGTGLRVENATNVTVRGNRIGTNAEGMSALANGSGGVQFASVTNSVIRDNLISGNIGFGIGFFGGAGTSGNAITGNLIGTDAAGTATVPNGGGISFFAGGQGTGLLTNNVIGGATAAERNVISGNSGSAISFAGGPKVSGNAILGNYIGVAADGSTALGNGLGSSGSFAVGFFAPTADGPSDNRVEANVIAYTGGAAVIVGAGVQNAITANSIFSNAALGIDLGGDGVTLNDAGDADTGPNELINFPVLTAATTTPGRLVVVGSIDTPSPETAVIELFANAAGDPSGHGEGETFLGTVTPNANGRFVATLPPVPAGTLVTATATDTAGSTSEFSRYIAAHGPGSQ